MNFVQKNLIKARPNIIFNKIVFPEIDNEILEFAINNGLTQTDPAKLQELFSNEDYFSRIIKLLDDNTLAMLIGSFPNIKNELIKTLKISKIRISELPYSVLESSDVIKCLCERDLDEVFDFFSNDNARSQMIYGFVIQEIKNYMLEDGTKNITYFEKFLKTFNDQIYYTSDERKKIEEACINNNIVISDEFPVFLKHSKVILNSLLNVKSPFQINNLKETTRRLDLYILYSGDSKAINKTVKDIANKIREVGYIYDRNLTPQFIISNTEFIHALLENNPYTIEELDSKKIYDLQSDGIETKNKIVKQLKKNNYIFSAKTPDFLISDSPELLLEALEMDFDNFKNVPKVPLNCSDEEADDFLKKQFNIVKQHDPDFLEKKFHLVNPYIFREAIKRGIYTINDNISEYYVLKIPRLDKIAPFLKEYYDRNNIVPGEVMKDILDTVEVVQTLETYNNEINGSNEVIDNTLDNIYEIRSQMPDFIGESSNFKSKEELRKELPQRYFNKDITEDEFIKYLDELYFYDYVATEYANIIHSNPEIINKFSKLRNVPLYNTEILAAVINELRENTELKLDKKAFEKFWKSSSTFQEYIISERADLLPLLPQNADFNTSEAVQTLSRALIKNNLNISDYVKDEYFPSKLFRFVNIQEYKKIVDNLIANNPENIFMMSSFSEEQDYVLHERYKYLIESKIIDYNMEKFKVPHFYNSGTLTNETINALRNNPNLINIPNIEIYNLYNVTEEEKNIVKMAIESSLDSSKELPSFLKFTPELYEDIINKDINFVRQLPPNFQYELYPLIEMYFAKNNIKYDENLPDFLKEFYRIKYIESGYPQQQELKKELGTFFSDQIRSNPELVAKYADLAYNEGFVILDDDPIEIKTNPELILSSIENDPLFVYKINENAVGLEEFVYEIKEMIINSKEFKFQDNLPEFLKNSTELFMYAITIDINNRKFFNENRVLTEEIGTYAGQIERTEEIKKIYLRNKIYLQDTEISILAKDPEYVFESLKNANNDDIQKIIDCVDLNGFNEEEKQKLYNMLETYIDDGLYTFSEKSNPLLLLSNEVMKKAILKDFTIIKFIKEDDMILSIESYREIYNIFKNNQKKYTEDKDLMKFMEKNPYYIANQILEDIENIDNYNFDGLYIDEELKEKISNKLLEINYKITDKTPSFLLLNKKFLINYIKQQESIDGIPKKYIANIFRSDKILLNNEIIEVSKYLNNIQTPFTKYINSWGIESIQELYNEYGTLINYLDISKKYTLEEAKIYLENYIQNNTNATADEICMFYTKLKLKVKAEDFKKHIELCYSDEFVKLAIEQDLSFVMEYKGTNEDILILAKDVLPDDLYYLEDNFASSTKLMSALIEKKPENIQYYKGNDKEVVNLAIKKGIFENKNENEINEILISSEAIRYSDDAIKYLIENNNPEYIEQYIGKNEELFKFAIDKGYIPTMQRLLKNGNISENEIMIKEAIKNDVYCHGFLYKKYSESEKLNIVKQLLGDDLYSKIFEDKNNKLLYSKTENDFLALTSIIQTNKEGVEFLKLINKDFINEVGFDEWRKIVKYSFKNKNLEHLHNILEKSDVKKLFKFINQVSPLIKDDKALGVNKFLTITRFYDMNSSFCDSLLEKLNKDEKLTELELVNLETLIYRNSKINIHISSFDLNRLIEIEQMQLRDDSVNGIAKDKIFTFLFNMSENEVNEFLNTNINSKTIAQIRSRAIEEKNKKLLLETDYIGIIIDIMENIKYNYSDTELNNILKTLANAPQSQIVKMRKVFANVPEIARHFYEIEAQEELTNLQSIIENDTKSVTEYKGVKIIDLSNKKHTVYAHVYEGIDFESFFNTDLGKVTICVSPETDKHEAYYYGANPDHKTVMFFNNIPNGTYIGSSIENMGSNGFISFNDYEIKSTKIYNQRSIRESYSGDEHPETLLYRQGLIPAGLIINQLPPSDSQIRKLKSLQEEVRKIEGHENDILYFIRTQGIKKRTINYIDNLSSQRENESEDENDIYLDEIENNIQQLRKNFFGLLNIDDDNTFIRYLSQRGERYSVIDGGVFSEKALSKKQQESIKLAVELEKIVHKENPDTVLKYAEIKDNKKNKFLMKELTDSRTLWNLTRKDLNFSEDTTEIFLKEFLIDHLMCNYSVGNNDFVLNSHNILQATNKNGALSDIEDFISNNGEPHTEMSYYYYDNSNNHGKNANNVYRKIFESYINNPNGNEIIKEKIFEKMVQAAQTISYIPTDKYMEMFKGILENIENVDLRKKAESLIRARKESIVEDTSEFIERIKSERKIAQNIEKIECADTVALISDIHGNAAALEEILKKCKQEGKTDVFVLGDMIGFGAESNECLDILREKFPMLKIRCILGNHELYSLMGNSSFQNKLGITELELTKKIRKDISTKNRRFLESLPITRTVEIEGNTFLFTHFPLDKEFYNDSEIYMSHGASMSDLQDSTTDYVIYGHEHRTEYTRGNEVGTIYARNIDGSTFINLPSSGCVHGNNTTYGVISTKDDTLQVDIVPLQFNKEKNDEAIRKTHNPYSYFFGTKNSGGGTR